MMISWMQAEDIVGRRPEQLPAYYEYFAYSKGKVLGSAFSCKELTGKFGWDILIEQVHINKEEQKVRAQEIQQYSNAVFDLWYKELRSDYPELSDAKFGLCYSEAYARAHSSGYDEVAEALGGVVSFALQLEKAE